MKKYIFIIIVLILCIVSCTKQDRNNSIINQQESIDRYIASLGTDAKIVKNGGAARIIINDGSGEEIVNGDSVIFYYAAYIFNNGKGELFATNNVDVAKENSFQTTGAPERKVIGNKDLLIGLSDGLIGAKTGEICNIVFSAKYGYNNTVVYNVPKLSPLFFEVWIDSVVKN